MNQLKANIRAQRGGCVHLPREWGWTATGKQDQPQGKTKAPFGRLNKTAVTEPSILLKKAMDGDKESEVELALLVAGQMVKHQKASNSPITDQTAFRVSHMTIWKYVEGREFNAQDAKAIYGISQDCFRIQYKKMIEAANDIWLSKYFREI